MIAELNHKTVKTENKVRIENEVDKTKDFSQWEANRDKGQISKEILYNLIL